MEQVPYSRIAEITGKRGKRALLRAERKANREAREGIESCVIQTARPTTQLNGKSRNGHNSADAATIAVATRCSQHRTQKRKQSQIHQMIACWRETPQR
jgi:hypothetical protein